MLTAAATEPRGVQAIRVQRCGSSSPISLTRCVGKHSAPRRHRLQAGRFEDNGPARTVVRTRPALSRGCHSKRCRSVEPACFLKSRQTKTSQQICRSSGVSLVLNARVTAIATDAVGKVCSRKRLRGLVRMAAGRGRWRARLATPSLAMRVSLATAAPARLPRKVIQHPEDRLPQERPLP